MSGPELSSIGSALDDLARRLTAIAESAGDTGLGWAAQDLFEVERSLGRARRRLAKVTEDMSRKSSRD